MRIAIGGLHVECSTFNPVPVRLEDFLVLRGDDLLAHRRFAFLRDHQVMQGGNELAPLLHARAIPGGPVALGDYLSLKTEFLSRLQAAGPLDAVYLAMHGAMFVAGMEDAEGDFITAVRAAVGPDMPIAVSYDLHGNLSQKIIDAIDIYTTYRTAPHLDEDETQLRALDMLLRHLGGGDRAGVLWVPVPVLVSGECSSTRDEPARSLYAALPGLVGDGVWDVSLNVGYVWADEPRATAAVVVTGTDRAAMADRALQVARAYWDAREAFVFGAEVATPYDMLSTVSGATPLVLSDSGDNPTGGGVGDRVDLLKRLIAARVERCIVAGIADPTFVASVRDMAVGTEITRDLGHVLDPEGGEKLTVSGVLAYRDDQAAVVKAGGIEIAVTARRRPFHHLADFHGLGLAPEDADLVVVKSGYLEPEIAALAGHNILVLSQGAVDQDILRRTRHRMSRPCHPWDRAFDYRPTPFPSARWR